MGGRNATNWELNFENTLLILQEWSRQLKAAFINFIPNSAFNCLSECLVQFSDNFNRGNARFRRRSFRLLDNQDLNDSTMEKKTNANILPLLLRGARKCQIKSGTLCLSHQALTGMTLIQCKGNGTHRLPSRERVECCGNFGHFGGVDPLAV